MSLQYILLSARRKPRQRIRLRNTRTIECVVSIALALKTMGEAAIEALEAEAYPDFSRFQLQAYPNPMGVLRS